jgi:hypothetical protein
MHFICEYVWSNAGGDGGSLGVCFALALPDVCIDLRQEEWTTGGG